MLVSIVCIFAFIASCWIFHSRKQSSIPNVFGLPVLGFLWNLKSKDYQKQLSKLLEMHGKVCTVQLGSYKCFWLNDYKLIRETWSNPKFCGRPIKLPGILDRTNGFSGGIIFNECEDFTEQRRFAVKHLKELGLGKNSMENTINDEVDAVLEKIAQQDGLPMSTRHLFSMASLNVLWTIISGERYDQEDKTLNDLMETLTRNMELQDGAMIGFFIPWLAKIFPRFVGWDAYIKDANKVFIFWKQYAHKRIQSYNPEQEINCFADLYIKQIKECTDDQSSFFGNKGELSLAVTLQDLFIAGTETTATTLSWILRFCAAHQKYQNDIFEEISLVIGENRKAALTDRRKMPMTEAFILETMRHVTLAPLGMIHSTTEETQLCDVIIPKGSLIHANLCAAHNDPTVWKDGNDFIPERFISEDGSVKSFDSFLAFSHGKRKCPGESLARNELFLFLVGIIQNYRVEMSSNCSADFLLPNLGVSATPKPHHLEFYKR